jgi:ADP-heptose:LPS heptosyltransferase
VRLLLVCLDNIGDLVFTSSLVEPLKMKYPDAQWTILCKDYAADIARSFDVEADVVAADPWWMRSPGRQSGGILRLLKALAYCRAQKPQMTIVASSNWRAAAVAWLIGSPMRVGFNRKKARWFLTHKVSVDRWSETPITRSLSRLLEPFGIKTQEDSTPPVAMTIKQEPALAKALPEKAFMVLHPFAGSLSRCWPLSCWGQLATAIRKAGFVVVWMGREDEAGQVLKAVSESSQDEWMYQFNKGQLALTLFMTSKATCLVGHDSGPIHFAAALGVPVLGLYLPSLYPSTVTNGRATRLLIHRQSPQDLSVAHVWSDLARILNITT